AVGDDYPVMMRLSRSLKVPETFAEEDMLTFIKSVENYVDIINVSCGMDCYGGTIENYTANTYSHTTIFIPRMYNLEFCEKVKKESKALVCIVGGVSDPKAADELIANGKVDMVMLGRQLIADPFWPKKAQEGRDEDIVPCLRCLHCYHISTEHANTQCSVNPRFRRENRVPLKPVKTDSPKRVVVIGGGPAGMNAALIASERGHKVILLEKAGELGGNLIHADYGDYKSDLRKYREYLKKHISRSSVEVQLGTEASYDYVKSLVPNAILIAIGADFITPGIPGTEYAVQAANIYPRIDSVKGDVVIIGGGMIGSEIALELANRKNNVTVVEMQDALAKNGNWLYRHGLYNAIKDSDNKPSIRLETSVKEIKKDGVVLAGKNGKEEYIKADHILLAVGMKPKKDMAFSFYGITPETAMLGDCFRVAQVLEAVNDSYFIAANL
ncbi:MAG: FAD-dependent oxidoreductase, partial [Treponema sp.]|nr:FAD-dependent oxidoreductase [Treponema sp.]